MKDSADEESVEVEAAEGLLRTRQDEQEADRRWREVGGLDCGYANCRKEHVHE